MNEQVARPATYGEMAAATASVAIWLYFLVAQGAGPALEASPFLVLGVLLGAWTLLIRLRFSPTRLVLAVGPWRRSVDLEAIESVHWKMTGGGRSRGTIFVSDRRGRRVPICVGRFRRSDEWGPVLLEAAARAGADVDPRTRDLLEGGDR